MLTNQRLKRILYAASVGASPNWRAALDRPFCNAETVRVIVTENGRMREAFEISRNHPMSAREIYQTVRESCRYYRGRRSARLIMSKLKTS